MGSSARVSIPKSARPTIQNIKEIAGNHSDEEIYAMLKECSMDPNETAQKLLHQDTFHEVKRKRDKRKENNKEPSETRWRPTSQERGGRGGRGNYPRYMAHDVGGERIIGKENGITQGTDRGTTTPSPLPHDKVISSANHIESSVVGHINGSKKFVNVTSVEGPKPKGSFVVGTVPVEDGSATTISKIGMPPIGSVGTIEHEVGSQRSAVEATVKKAVSRTVARSELSVTGKESAEMNQTYTHVKMQGKSHGFDGNQLPEGPQGLSSLSRTSSSGSRPSSNYSNRSQQQSGPQRVGPAKEWKPKATNVKPAQAIGTLGTSDVELVTGKATTSLVPTSSLLSLEDSATKLQRKLEELQVSDSKHVIIPNHLQVPESERTGLSFGSFDANFGLSTSFVNDPESDKNSAKLSEPSQEIEEKIDEPISSSIQIVSTSTQEADYVDQPPPAPQAPEPVSSMDSDISSSIPTLPEYDQSKPGAAVAQEGSQYSVVHTAPTYSNIGLVPQMLSNQFATFDGAETQARDMTRIPSFIVPQPFDPSTSYYASVYRPSVDGDGRFSPFFAPAAVTKYNGNIAVLPAQTGQSAQESANTLVLSSTGPAPLVTQPAGVMQSSVTVSQQTVPVFRQPTGVHVPHYPANYLPYSQYFSPFYGPPPTIHPFLSNAAFPQQPPTGSIYPTPAAAAASAAPVKFALSQYKPSSNAGNPSHAGMPVGYGTYSPSAVTTGNSTGSEDHASSQYKENNVYIAGQQSEGSAVWIPTPGRDISAFQPTSFYNLPQGQHMTFPGIYHHPAQAVAAGTVHPLIQQPQATAGAVEMVGPTGVYQQPQRTWVNNY